MKTKLFGLLMIMLFAFTSCSKDEVAENTNQERKPNYELVWNEKYQLYQYVFESQGQGRSPSGNVYFNDGSCGCSVSIYDANLDMNLAPTSISCWDVPGIGIPMTTFVYVLNDGTIEEVDVPCPPR